MPGRDKEEALVEWNNKKKKKNFKEHLVMHWLCCTLLTVFQECEAVGGVGGVLQNHNLLSHETTKEF